MFRAVPRPDAARSIGAQARRFAAKQEAGERRLSARLDRQSETALVRKFGAPVPRRPLNGEG